jgi:RNA polymerase sigma-70 factor (ECF subfamily)
MNFPRSGRFASTRWTLVLAARSDSPRDAAEALAALYEFYWPPLYAYARRCGNTVEAAQDLTQAFFTRFLERREVDVADPRRGRFRSFLLTSFKHFLSNEREREQALKRGGNRRAASIDIEAAEHQFTAALADTLTPESLFERQWALGVIERGLTKLRAECVEAGKEAAFTHLHEYVMGDRQSGGYARVARALGTTEGAVRVTIHRLRRRMRELLRIEVAFTVSDDSEIEDEVRYLIDVLTR